MHRRRPIFNCLGLGLLTFYLGLSIFSELLITSDRQGSRRCRRAPLLFGEFFSGAEIPV